MREHKRKAINMKWLGVRYEVLLLVLVMGFCYGLLMMERQIFPYEELAKIWMYAKNQKSGVPDVSENTKTISSALSPLQVEEHLVEFKQSMGASPRGGGGIASYNGAILGVNRWGQFFKYQASDIVELPLTIETNLAHISGLKITEEQLKKLNIDIDYIKARGFNPDNPSFYNTRSFRFLDLEIASIDGLLSLFVSYYYWYPEEKCKAIRVSMLRVSSDSELYATDINSQWKTLFETQPCLKIDYRNNSPFQSPNSGGRLAYSLHEKKLYFSVGDHHLDGYNNEEKAPQSNVMDYGKVYRINPSDGKAVMYSMGHRNPQGLYVTDNAGILLAEHGPKGGDELNVLSEKGNYGWPKVSFGAQYGQYEWPLSDVQGTHSNYELPLYAWLPSIGTSNITKVTKDSGTWSGDIIVSSLKAASLFRLRLRESHPAYVEKIYIGERIRDLHMLASGKIALWTDSSKLMFVEPER